MTTTRSRRRKRATRRPATGRTSCWAWPRPGSRSPSGPGPCCRRSVAYFKQALGLTSFQQALLVAVPVIVGALGRIPVGALTDRYGGRVMFPVVSFATIVPVLFLGLIGYRSLTMLLVGGFFLGLAGTSFAVGVPFVSAWFPAERRGWRSASSAWAWAGPRSAP